LISKLLRASKELKIKHIAIAGGVSANSGLRAMLEETGEKHQLKTYIPAFQYCTDNAGMIAIAAYHKFLQKDFSHQQAEPIARWGVDVK
jgi:N6-L-threonylcarbamoyladenine synthase